MTLFDRLARDFGLQPFDGGSLTLSLVAIGIGALAWIAGFALARRVGPVAAGWWENRAGQRVEGVADRMDELLRYLVILLLLAIALRAYAWPPLAALLIGLPLASACGLFVRQLLRAAHLPRWGALAVGVVAFVAVLAESVGGLAPIAATLDSIGFTIGARRFSLLSVVQIGVALVALFVIVRLINRLVGQTIKRSATLDPTQQLLAQKLAAVAIIIGAFLIGIDVVGIDLTALAVFSGALGLAVGFGLQKTIGNLIAGIILLMDRSIKPGDVISVGDSFGAVNKIGVRAVSIITREAKEHLIPNEIMMTEEVVNWSYTSRNVRISIPVGVSYDSDIKLAQKLMAECALASKRVLDSPAPKVWLRAFGDNAVEHEIRLWIRDPEDGIGPVQSEVLNRVWDAFKDQGIGLPFPQRDIHVKSWPKPESSARSVDPEQS